MSPASQPATPPMTMTIKIDSLLMVALLTEVYYWWREIIRSMGQISVGGTDCIWCGRYTHQRRGRSRDHHYRGEAEHERNDRVTILFRQLMDAPSRHCMIQLTGGQTFIPLGSAWKSRHGGHQAKIMLGEQREGINGVPLWL